MTFPLFLSSERMNKSRVYQRVISCLRFGEYEEAGKSKIFLLLFTLILLYILTITFLACYDFRAFYHTIQSTNPHACIFPILQHIQQQYVLQYTYTPLGTTFFCTRYMPRFAKSSLFLFKKTMNLFCTNIFITVLFVLSNV